jgi:ribonuclease HII
MPALLPCYADHVPEAGCDEAGRGCLAGPVVAAAVILPKGWQHPLLNDSKQMKQSHREALRPVIEAEALSWGVGVVWPAQIDQMNIMRASFAAMHRALDVLRLRPGHILVDGNRFVAYKGVPYQCEVKGDGRFLHIAAASVLAKTHRDAIMNRLHEEHPQYGWNRNKGYPTVEHRKAIAMHGHCEYHRLSFTLLSSSVLQLFDV